MVYEILSLDRTTERTSQKTAKPTHSNNLITGVLFVALLGAWGYIVYDKNKSKEAIAEKESEIMSTRRTLDNLQVELDNVTMRYEEVKTENLKKDNVITEKENRIQALIQGKK